MQKSLAYELRKTEHVIGLVDGKECQILINDTLQKKGDGVFIDVVYINENLKAIPVDIKIITLFPKDEDKNIRAKAILTFRAKRAAEKRKK